MQADVRFINGWIRTAHSFTWFHTSLIVLSTCTCAYVIFCIGWMSNRGRQCVASFLTKDMKVDWRMGAEWFETCLLGAYTNVAHAWMRTACMRSVFQLSSLEYFIDPRLSF